MQVIVLMLSLSAVLGVRGHRTDEGVPRWLLFGMSFMLAVAFLSRRFV